MALTGSSLYGSGKRIWRTDGPNYVKFTSTATAQPNFRYCVRVYRGTALNLATPAALFFYAPNPSNEIIIDVGEIISQQMRYARLDSNERNISRPQNQSGQMFGKTDGVEGIAGWVVECREGFDVAGVFTIDNAGAIAVIPFMMKGGFSMTNFINPQPSGAQFLTLRTAANSPWIGQRKYALVANVPCVPTNFRHWASFAFMNDNGVYVNGANWVSMRYSLYEGDTLLHQHSWSINSSGGAANNTATPSDKLLWVGCGEANINAAATGIIPDASKPAQNPTWTHYFIESIDNTDRVVRRLCFFHRHCWESVQGSIVTVRWSNSLGGYEHYTFDKVNTLTMDVERKEVFTQGLNYSGTLIKPTPEHHGRAVAATRTEQVIELKTGMLTVAERRLLQTIVQAQHVYIQAHEIPTGGNIGQIPQNLPCVVDESSKAAPIRENFALDTFTIKLKPSYDIVNNL